MTLKKFRNSFFFAGGYIIRLMKIIENDLAKKIIAKGIHIRDKYSALYLRNKQLNYCNMTTDLFLSVKKFENINHRCKRNFFLENLGRISFVQDIVYKFRYIFIKWTSHNQFTLQLKSEFLLYDDWLNIINLNKAPPEVFLKL